VVQGFKNFRGCPRAAHQFKVFQNAEDWYAVIATNAVENNTEIYSFNTVITNLKMIPFYAKFKFFFFFSVKWMWETTGNPSDSFGV
jgi:hypothetical protein